MFGAILHFVEVVVIVFITSVDNVLITTAMRASCLSWTNRGAEVWIVGQYIMQGVSPCWLSFLIGHPIIKIFGGAFWLSVCENSGLVERPTNA